MNDKAFVSFNSLHSCLQRDPDLGLLPPNQLPQILQTLYIVSGCDYVSFFVGFGKAKFYQTFFQFASFISGSNAVSGSLGDVKSESITSGLLSFYRLIGCLYFVKYKNAFEFENPVASFRGVPAVEFGSLLHHLKWLDMIREVCWERIEFEDQLVPSNEALMFHWLRSCSVVHIWSQAVSPKVLDPPYNSLGWKVQHGSLTVKWDSDANIERIKKNIVFLMKGCKCKGGCNDRRCGCFKQHKDCGPGCKCSNCKNLHNGRGACKGTKSQKCPRLSESDVENTFENEIREVNKNEQALEDEKKRGAKQ